MAWNMKEPNICRALLRVQLSNDLYMLEKKLPENQGRLLESSKWNDSYHSQMARNIKCSHQSEWRELVVQGTWGTFLKRLSPY